MKSLLTNKEIIFERYVAELICIRLAAYKKEKLYPGFWSEPQWSRFYKFQIRLAYQLTRLYSQNALLKALDECWWVCTLRDKKLDPVIQKHLESEPKPIPKAEGIWAQNPKNKLRDI